MNLGIIYIGTYIILFGIIAFIVYIILSKHQKKQQANLNNQPEQYQSGSSQPKNNTKRRNTIIALVLSLIITPVLEIVLVGGLPKIVDTVTVASFKIEGKWKVENDGAYSAKYGDIVSFDGTRCNIISPVDTYAFYKGDHTKGTSTSTDLASAFENEFSERNEYDYTLDCTILGSENTITFGVKIYSKDSITLYKGDTTISLLRVQ